MSTQPEPTPETKRLTDALAQYVQAPASDPYLASCAATATDMVVAHCGPAVIDVPRRVLDRAVLEVAANLYHRRATLGGVTGLEDTETTMGESVPRNPMTPAYPILRPYMWPAIA